jgi:LacI family transcriptional regulator
LNNLSNVTIKDIAEKAEVSTATVSRVLNNSGYASPENKEKVLSVAKELNYRPNGIARSLKMHKTNTIGIIIPDISNPYFMKISKGIEDTIQKKDYILIFASGDENPVKEEKTLKVFLENRVEAIVLATSSDNHETISRIQEAGVPVVLIDRKLESQKANLDLVVEDNVNGAYQLTKHLIQQGHCHIGVINGSLTVSTGRERYEGYQKAMKEFDLEEHGDFIFTGNFHEKDGKEAVKHFFQLETKPTAILSFNNTMTYGAVLQLTQMGMKVPDEIVVASYGETNIAPLLKPPGIVSVKQFPYEMGVKAGEILLDRLMNKDKEIVKEVFNPVLNLKE